MVKLIYLVLDGVADRLIDRPTSLELADKPTLDNLARRGICGVMYTVGKGYAPESDVAVLSILGYDPEKYYTGRGPLEALGAGIRIKEEYEVAFRANFATIDPRTLRIIDRRVGRTLTTDEARKLAEAVDNLDLGLYEGYVKVKATIGHRAVVVIGSRRYKLSDNVDNSDPAYARKGKISVAVKDYEPYLKQVKPLDETEESKKTAELANIFTQRVIEILDKHPVNVEREKKGLLKANLILLRDAGGKLPKIEPIEKRFNRKFAAITEMPVEKGIARLLGMEIIEVPPPTQDKRRDYAIRLDATLNGLRKADVVYVHLKGPDEPGHDGNLKGKVKSIELIDEYFVRPLLDHIDLEETAILVTADHATPPVVKAHTDDPVPVVLVHAKIKPDSVEKLMERECYEKGSLGIIEHGYELLPKVFRILETIEKQ
ncbi:MAG TPA: 2,3-bisphosphoglycerate-independent phosphoglycerate mutase [Desulfurococcaceae archaeon]|nr:2,3-bisphosphoglycerate-independent phosphoglycerate mutase [Desulfurococcaceae archaeon]